MPDKEPRSIGSKVTVKGSISGNQELVVEGRVEGRIGIEDQAYRRGRGIGPSGHRRSGGDGEG